jgi:VanZ family protein
VISRVAPSSIASRGTLSMKARVFAMRACRPAKSVSTVLVARHLDAAQARHRALGEIGRHLHLAQQREHVREQARLQQRVRLDLLQVGMGFGLFQDRRQAAQDLPEDRHRGGVHR